MWGGCKELNEKSSSGAKNGNASFIAPKAKQFYDKSFKFIMRLKKNKWEGNKSEEDNNYCNYHFDFFFFDREKYLNGQNLSKY